MEEKKKVMILFCLLWVVSVMCREKSHSPFPEELAIKLSNITD